MPSPIAVGFVGLVDCVDTASSCSVQEIRLAMAPGSAGVHSVWFWLANCVASKKKSLSLSYQANLYHAHVHLVAHMLTCTPCRTHDRSVEQNNP